MTDALRDKLAYGNSTLQGGGISSNLQTTIIEARLPDIDLNGEWSEPFPSGSDPYPFGYLYPQSLGSPPVRSTGQLLAFQTIIYDPYGLATVDIFGDPTGMTIGSAHGTKNGIPYDFRSGVFELGALVETAPNEVGDRTLSVCLTVYDVDTFNGIEYIVLDQSVLPTTATRSTLQMFCPRVLIDYLSFEARVREDLAANEVLVDETTVFNGYLSLHLHQTSGEALGIYRVHFWVKKIQDLAVNPAP